MDKNTLQKNIQTEIESLLKAGNKAAAKLLFAKKAALLVGYMSYAQYQILEQDLTEIEGATGRAYRTELTKLLDAGLFPEADQYFKLHNQQIGWSDKIYKEEKTRIKLAQLRMKIRNEEEVDKQNRSKNKATILEMVEAGQFLEAEKLYTSSCESWWDRKVFNDLIENKKAEIDAENLRLEGNRLIPEMMQSNYLGTDDLYNFRFKKVISIDEYHQLKQNFIRAWFEKYFISSNYKNQLPDLQQALAIGSFNKDIQVIARAGSGKTTTIVNRAIFLLQHCHIPPNKILLLAFNRDAVLEIQKRLFFLMASNARVAYEDVYKSKRALNQKVIDPKYYREFIYKTQAASISEAAEKIGISLPPVMTFHALAKALADPTVDIIYDEQDGSQLLTRFVQDIIDEYRRSDIGYQKVRSLMLTHFRADWEKLLVDRVDLSKEELVAFKRSLPNESLLGDPVKSYGEKLIANFLFEHGVPYRYEKAHEWSGSRYQPDFTIEKERTRSGIIIEYFGLMSDPHYAAQVNSKRDFWKSREEWTLLELYPEDITSESDHETLYRKLKIVLTRHEIPFHKLSEDEIWEKIKERAIDNFSKAIKSFLSRCRKINLSINELMNLATQHQSLSQVESDFIDIGIKVYKEFLAKIKAGSLEDFDGLLINASHRVASGQLGFRRKSVNYNLKDLEYLFIDEFQDFSELFNNLIEEIVKVSKAEVFCVGDNWQAINGFAGSDLKYFNNFKGFSGNSELLYISSNYRSKSTIVELGNSLMKNLGSVAVAVRQESGKVTLANLSNFLPSSYEREKFSGSNFLPAVLRLVGSALGMGFDVVLLTRTNSIPYPYPVGEKVIKTLTPHEKFRETVRSYFPEAVRGKISISTAHKYKGLEKKAVIILDAIDRSYPLIHPNWIFSRIFGDKLEKIISEERRLFYVAATRAADHLMLLTDDFKVTPFLKGLDKHLTKLNWTTCPAIVGDESIVIVKISNLSGFGSNPTFSLKELLKESGYKYQNSSWTKAFSSNGFSIDSIKNEAWTISANGILVELCDQSDTCLKSYKINFGNWI